MPTKKLSLRFEVYGNVQGVSFRKYTKQEAKKLGLKGWCMNTDRGTVVGILEGNANKIADMKNWLQTVGSPKSKVESALFENENEIKIFTYNDFKIKK